MLINISSNAIINIEKITAIYINQQDQTKIVFEYDVNNSMAITHETPEMAQAYFDNLILKLNIPAGYN